MLSNKLTFSLASLILVLVLGLVFAPMSAMAHTLGTDAHDVTDTDGHAQITSWSADKTKLSGMDDDEIVVTVTFAKEKAAVPAEGTQTAHPIIAPASFGEGDLDQVGGTRASGDDGLMFDNFTNVTRRGGTPTWEFTISKATAADDDDEGEWEINITSSSDIYQLDSVDPITITLDSMAPELASEDGIAITSEGPYKAGQAIKVTFTFDEMVMLDTTKGSPDLPIQVGNARKLARYASGSGTKMLVFSYLVQSGDMDDDGVTIDASSLALNGAIIKDDHGNSVGTTLTHSEVEADEDHVVDTALPPSADFTVTEVMQTSVKLMITTPVDGATYMYRDSTDGGTRWSNSKTVPDNGVIENLIAGTTYTFEVTATQDGKMSKSTQMATTDAALTAPEAPTGVSAEVDPATNMVTITWGAVAGATHYTITQTGTASATYPAAGSQITGTRYITGMLAAGDYMFKVMAHNTVGESPASTAANATINASGDTTPPVVNADNVPGIQPAAFYLKFRVVEANLPASTATPPYGIMVTGNPDAVTGKYSIGTVMMDREVPNGYKVMITPTSAASLTASVTEKTVTFTVKATDTSNLSHSGTATAVLAARTAPDTTLPTVTVAGTPSLTNRFAVTFTFSKAVDLSVSDISVTGAYVITDSISSDTAKKVWTADVQPRSGAKVASVSIISSKAMPKTTATGSISTETPREMGPGRSDVPAMTIPAHGFAVIVKNRGASQISDDADGRGTDTVIRQLDFLDLDRFLFNGGTIELLGPSGATKQDIVISEIMWGIDDAITPASSRDDVQWIELYNTTNKAIVIASRTWQLNFLGPRLTESDDAIDFVGTEGPLNYWRPKGQSGRTARDRENNLQAIELISMYRKIDYKKVEKADHDKSDSAKNRETQLEGVPHGETPGNWEASSIPAYNLESRWIIGSPGHKGTSRPTETATVLAQDVIINEIGNGSSDEDDWVELLNTTSAEINIKNWELSIVTLDADGKHSDKALVTFPDNDNTKLPANGILVIANTSPTSSGNDLEAGIEIDVASDDQEKRGLTSLYYVDSNLKLPNSGKSLLILRNANDKEGKPEKVVDAGGTLFVEVKDSDFSTQVWPLQSTGKGHDNTIDATDNEDFRAGGVYQRNAKNSGIGEKHWKKVGWTGVGYDRTAKASDENGGTPGYANDSLKEKVADLSSNAEVSISEIMFDTGIARRRLPQWIELYNSSMTQAVNLDGWKLEIQNARAEDVDARLNATITLKKMTIAPNQTVLIVSTSGLNSGSDNFPDTRVVNLWTTKEHREGLDMTTRNDRVLSASGFFLRLTDKDKKVVDEAGNLDGNRRTLDDPAWALPMNGDERRSSIIRRYESGVADPGTSQTGWVLASDTALAYIISHTYYGDSDDFGSPGFRGGGPLPVSLSSFRPVRDKATGAVVIRWMTESELDNAGFNILRSETKTGEFAVVNLKGIIPGHGTTSEKHTYEWKDTTAKPNVVYYYQIEDVSLDGKRTTLATTHLRGNVNAAGKLTTRWGDLKDSRY